MKRRDFIAGGLAVTGLSSIWLGAAQAQEADPSAIIDMVLGDENAPVTVIEYASYTCPHCANFHVNMFKDFKADYIDTGKVRFIYREVYFDRFGLWASMVARCGGQDRFFAISDMIYEKQREWTASGDPATIAGELRKFGKLAGLDDAALDACMQDAQMAQNLVAWWEQNSQADGIRSTPSFVIDGEKFEGNWANELTGAIDAALG